MTPVNRACPAERFSSPLASRSPGLRRLGSLAVAVALGCGALVSSTEARADESSPSGKGIAGGALLGGELVMSVEAAFGVDRPWAYAVGGIVGAAGGGVAGHFIEAGASDAHIPSYMLAGGVAFLIPSFILALNATAYQPPVDYDQDAGTPGAEPVAEPPSPSTPPATPPGGSPSVPPATTPPAVTPPPSSKLGPQAPGGGAVRVAQQPFVRRYHRRSLSGASVQASGSMVHFDLQREGSLKLGLPAVELRPTFSIAERRQYGMEQHEEVRVPVFQALF
jgi:hypothetical protein